MPTRMTGVNIPCLCTWLSPWNPSDSLNRKVSDESAFIPHPHPPHLFSIPCSCKLFGKGCLSTKRAFCLSGFLNFTEGNFQSFFSHTEGLIADPPQLVSYRHDMSVGLLTPHFQMFALHASRKERGVEMCLDMSGGRHPRPIGETTGI